LSMSIRTPVFRDHPIAALAFICLSVFVISVDATIVNVALPTLSRQLDADTAQLQWIVDAYTLVMAGLMLSMGSLSDRFGRRGWLSAGLAVFAITSAVASQVDSADALIWARAAMGVGAAVIFPTTLSLITNIFADPVKRAKAIGLWAAMVGVGVAAGPISGGWLLEHFSWGSVFMVNVPVAAVAIIGGVLFVPTSRDPAAPPVDLPGVILSSIGITALVYTVIEAPNRGWGSVDTAAGFAAAIVVLAAFALWERHTPHPMLDVSVFANRRFSGGSLAVTAGFLTLFGFIFVITQYFQFIKSYSAFETGVRLLPVAISIAVASIVGPRIVERIGTTTVVVAGLAIFAAGLAWASTADAATPYLEIAVQMLMLGGGLAVRRQGRRRLRRQRHHSRTRWHPRRRDRRQRLRLHLFESAGRQRGGVRAPRAGSGHDGTVDGRRTAGHRPAAAASDSRRPRGRQHRVPRRSSDRISGERRYRGRRRCRCRCPAAGPG
jgi:EmrB/QacA subfamily drug resistance transporter